MQTTMLDTAGVCDFCAREGQARPNDASWVFLTYNYENAVAEPKLKVTLASSENWLACDECRIPAERNDYEALTQLNNRALANHQIVIFWTVFFSMRLPGPPHPYIGPSKYGTMKRTIVHE